MSFVCAFALYSICCVLFGWSLAAGSVWWTAAAAIGNLTALVICFLALAADVNATDLK